MKKSDIKWVISAIIIPIFLVAGFFNNPEIHLVRQSNSDFVCPTYFYHNSEFNINFRNVGNKGTNLCVTLNSPDNITFIKRGDCLYSESGKKIPFSLAINTSQIYNLDSVRIDCNYKYNKFLIFVQNKNIACYYEREKGTNIALKLISQKFLN